MYFLFPWRFLPRPVNHLDLWCLIPGFKFFLLLRFSLIPLWSREVVHMILIPLICWRLCYTPGSDLPDDFSVVCTFCCVGNRVPCRLNYVLKVIVLFIRVIYFLSFAGCGILCSVVVVHPLSLSFSNVWCASFFSYLGCKHMAILLLILVFLTQWLIYNADSQQTFLNGLGS